MKTSALLAFQSIGFDGPIEKFDVTHTDSDNILTGVWIFYFLGQSLQPHLKHKNYNLCLHFDKNRRVLEWVI